METNLELYTEGVSGYSCSGYSVLVGLPAHLISCLQSVQNAAARLIFQIRRSEHITDVFLELHWLRIPERIVYKLAVQTYRALNGSAPRYLSSQLTCVADMPSRLRLRSASTQRLVVPAFRLTTVGRRAFPVASSNIWNALPDDVTSAPSLQIFRQRLKTHLFRTSYEVISLYSGSGPCSDTVTQASLKICGDDDDDSYVSDTRWDTLDPRGVIGCKWQSVNFCSITQFAPHLHATCCSHGRH